MFAGFRRGDKLPVPEIAVPVAVPEQCATVGFCYASALQEQAVGDLSLIDFYYLLRVGKYTQKIEKLSQEQYSFR